MAVLTKGRWLVVAPHADDEVLGLGPLLCWPESITVMILARRPHQETYEVSKSVGDCLEACRGWRREVMASPELVPLVHESMRDIIPRVHKVIADLQSDSVFIPSADSCHEDHLVGYRASMAALRPWRISHSSSLYSYRVLSDCPPKMGNTVVEVNAEDVTRAARAFDEVYKDQAREGRCGLAITQWAGVCGDWIGKPFGWSLELVQSTEYLE